MMRKKPDKSDINPKKFGLDKETFDSFFEEEKGAENFETFTNDLLHNVFKRFRKDLFQSQHYSINRRQSRKKRLEDLKKKLSHKKISQPVSVVVEDEPDESVVASSDVEVVLDKTDEKEPIRQVDKVVKKPRVPVKKLTRIKSTPKKKVVADKPVKRSDIPSLPDRIVSSMKTLWRGFQQKITKKQLPKSLKLSPAEEAAKRLKEREAKLQELLNKDKGKLT